MCVTDVLNSAAPSPNSVAIAREGKDGYTAFRYEENTALLPFTFLRVIIICELSHLKK